MKTVSKRLIQVINREHKAASANLAAYREHAKKCGEALIEAKVDITRGQWLPWLKENCPDLSIRTAQQYMAFARGDATDLSSGGSSRDRVKNESDSYSTNGNGHVSAEPDEDDVDDALEDDEDEEDEEEVELTEEEVKAVELVKQGKSYRQIAKELEVDESQVRRNPYVREAREAMDPDAHSKTNYASAACRTPTVAERLQDIKGEIEVVLGPMYTLNTKDKRKLKSILDEGLEALSHYGQERTK